MGKSDISILYADLNKLLNEISEFLSVSIDNGEIIGKAKWKAEALIEKSKQQLKIISIISPGGLEYDSNRYVDMTGKSKIIHEDDQIIYSPVENENEVEDTKSEMTLSLKSLEVVPCPYENMPAQEANKVKYGYLEKKEKFFVVDYNKKVYASVLDSWLLIYNSPKDSKPYENYHLDFYEAKAVTSSKEKSFELLSLNHPSHTPKIFTAHTKKDMYQWVAAINNPHKPNIVTNVDLKKYNKEKVVPKPFEEPEEIYETLVETSCSNTREVPELDPPPTLIKKLPALPERTNSTLSNINLIDRPVPAPPPRPITPTEHSDIEEPEYDPIDCGLSDNSEIYETLADVKEANNQRSSLQYDDDEDDEAEYDIIQHGDGKPDQEIRENNLKKTPSENLNSKQGCVNSLSKISRSNSTEQNIHFIDSLKQKFKEHPENETPLPVLKPKPSLYRGSKLKACLKVSPPEVPKLKHTPNLDTKKNTLPIRSNSKTASIKQQLFNKN